MDTLKRGQIAVEKKALKEHCNNVEEFIKKFDELMKLPSTHERGQKMAKLINALQFSNDSIKHFQLGEKL